MYFNPALTYFLIGQEISFKLIEPSYEQLHEKFQIQIFDKIRFSTISFRYNCRVETTIFVPFSLWL